MLLAAAQGLKDGATPNSYGPHYTILEEKERSVVRVAVPELLHKFFKAASEFAKSLTCLLYTSDAADE